MSGNKLLKIYIAAIFIAAVTLGFFLFAGKTENNQSPGLPVVDTASAGMGITYIPVTHGLSEYYGLGVEHGALITEVTPGSPADLAGLKTGDVILSFNDARLEEPGPLLGMMMACPAGHTVTMEIWRQEHIATIRVFHGERLSGD